MAAVLHTLEHLVVRATSKQTATVIFIHGLGDTGEGWKPIADMFKRDEDLSHVKWILPHAPVRPVTANMGMSMPSWFDIYSFGFDCEEDEKGMRETVQALNGLIAKEVEDGIPASRIVLGGFSQGGAISLLTGMTSERKLGGLAILSGWLPLRKKFKSMATEHANKYPIFWGHGTKDPLVRFEMGRASGDFLVKELGIKVVEEAENATDVPVGLSFHGYEGMVHAANDDELEDLRSWLKRVISNSDSDSKSK